MLGWSEVIGILIGFVLVVAYCYAGGIRASIWTDVSSVKRHDYRLHITLLGSFGRDRRIFWPSLRIGGAECQF